MKRASKEDFLKGEPDVLEGRVESMSAFLIRLGSGKFVSGEERRAFEAYQRGEGPLPKSPTWEREK